MPYFKAANIELSLYDSFGSLTCIFQRDIFYRIMLPNHKFQLLDKFSLNIYAKKIIKKTNSLFCRCHCMVLWLRQRWDNKNHSLRFQLRGGGGVNLVLAGGVVDNGGSRREVLGKVSLGAGGADCWEGEVFLSAKHPVVRTVHVARSPPQHFFFPCFLSICMDPTSWLPPKAPKCDWAFEEILRGSPLLPLSLSSLTGCTLSPARPDSFQELRHSHPKNVPAGPALNV